MAVCLRNRLKVLNCVLCLFQVPQDVNSKFLRSGYQPSCVLSSVAIAGKEIRVLQVLGIWLGFKLQIWLLMLVYLALFRRLLKIRVRVRRLKCHDVQIVTVFESCLACNTVSYDSLNTGRVATHQTILIRVVVCVILKTRYFRATRLEVFLQCLGAYDVKNTDWMRVQHWSVASVEIYAFHTLKK